MMVVWNSISDSLPPENKQMLLYLPHNGGVTVGSLELSHEDPIWLRFWTNGTCYSQGTSPIVFVTHWAPLPEPPLFDPGTPRQVMADWYEEHDDMASAILLRKQAEEAL